MRLALRRVAPRRQPYRIAAACSPPAVPRLARSLSRPGPASFRADRSPWAVCSAPSPSPAAFLLQPADGPEDFPLGGLRCRRSPVARVRKAETFGCGSIRSGRLALAGLLDSFAAAPWSCSPRGVDSPWRITPHQLFEPGLSRSLSAFAGDGWLESPRTPIARPPFDLRSLGPKPCGSWLEGRSTRSSMALRVNGGSCGSLAVPVAPSPSVDRAQHHRPADFRVFLHRRVQSNPKVCCNFWILCSFLGFVSPPRLSSLPVTALRSVCRVRVSLGAIPAPVSVRPAVSGDCSPVSAGLRSDSVCSRWGAASVAGSGLLGVLYVKERLSRLEVRGVVPKASALAALSVPTEIGRAHV